MLGRWPRQESQGTVESCPRMASAELVPCFPPFILAETQQAAVAVIFFFLILQCTFFFHMTSLRLGYVFIFIFIFIFLGYVFKSIISDNHAGQIRWRSYLVGSGRHFRCPDWSTAPSVYSSQTTDLRTI